MLRVRRAASIAKEDNFSASANRFSRGFRKFRNPPHQFLRETFLHPRALSQFRSNLFSHIHIVSSVFGDRLVRRGSTENSCLRGANYSNFPDGAKATQAVLVLPVFCALPLARHVSTMGRPPPAGRRRNEAKDGAFLRWDVGCRCGPLLLDSFRRRKLDCSGPDDSRTLRQESSVGAHQPFHARSAGVGRNSPLRTRTGRVLSAVRPASGNRRNDCRNFARSFASRSNFPWPV